MTRCDSSSRCRRPACTNTPEFAGGALALPGYRTVIACEPAANAVVVNVADPDTMVELPDERRAVVELDRCRDRRSCLSVAVSVTDCPTDDGLRFDAIVMDGVAAAVLTVCDAEPVPATNDASPS